MKQVLLIEPDKVLAGIYTEALTKAGYSVDRHVGAEEAISAVDAHRPDVVILELQLARHNGVEFLYEFRSYPEWASIPVVVLSQVPDPAFNAKLQAQLGVVAYHYKPRTTLQDLLRTLERIAGPTWSSGGASKP